MRRLSLIIAVAAVAVTVAVAIAPHRSTPGGPPSSVRTAAVKRIAPREAFALAEAGTALLLDVRSAAAFAESHIAGAVHVVSADLPARAPELRARGKTIIAYCT